MPNKLLLADDSPTIQKVVELVLEHEGFDIKAVGDGEQAVNVIKDFQPDIVLADIAIPGLNGYQLCEKIKSSPDSAHLPVILISGAFEPFDEGRANSVGADDVIIKPFEAQELITKVKSLLRGAAPAAKSADDVRVVEQAWDEDMPVISEDIAEEQGVIDEEFESSILPEIKEFEEELNYAIKGRPKATPEQRSEELKKPEIEFPSREDISAMLEKKIDEKISGIISSEVMPQVSLSIKDSVNQAMAAMSPNVIEDVVREIVRDSLSSLKGEIDTAIRRIVPEVAEAIIKKEIERITSEI